MNHKLSITCPKCLHEFHAEDALRKHLEEELGTERTKLLKAYELKEEKLQADLAMLAEKERNFKINFEKELKERETSLMEDLSAQMEKQYRETLDTFRKKVEAQNDQLKELRKKEIEIEDLHRKIADQGQELELKYMRQMNEKLVEERSKIQQNVYDQFELKMREKEKVLEDQKKQIEVMKRKIEQGSMQLQGEVQELVIASKLKELFPLDEVEEVSKGLRGADVAQLVINEGMVCGKLLYESKNTVHFKEEWIDKLRGDQMTCGAQTAILVTQAIPEGESDYFIRKGVVVCSLKLFPVVAALCRMKLVELKHQAGRFEMQKDTMGLLHQYLTGEEFRMRLEEMVAGFIQLKEQINVERRVFEKQWKERDMQVDKLLINTSQVYGAIKGIAGSSVKEIKSLSLLNC